jgi:YHS domain-containing protein
MNSGKAAMIGLAMVLGAGTILWSLSDREESAVVKAESHAAHSMEAMPAPAAESPREAGVNAGRLQRVPVNLVCMVNNRAFATPQIPVEVEGRTYYGCCEGCKEKLKTNREARMAVDPVSGLEVDKALAIIGSLPDGQVYYFGSAETMAAFDPARLN